MNETWEEILVRFKNTDKSRAGGYRRPLKYSDLSIETIRLAADQSDRNCRYVKHKNEDDDSKVDLVLAIEALDTIIENMIASGNKSVRYEANVRFKCKTLIVSLAIKRGLNAELTKDTKYIIVDCY